MNTSEINHTKNFKFVLLLKGVIDDERYSHLIFFINNFEELLLNREFHYIKLEMRYLYESIWKIIENGLRSSKKIQKEFGVTDYFLRVKSKRYGTISKEKHKTFSDLFKDLPWRGKMEKQVYEEFSEIYKKLHQYLHYNVYTIDSIRGSLKYSNIKIKDALNYGNFFFRILKWTMEEIYKINLDNYESDFNYETYNNYEPLMDNFIRDKNVSEIYNTNCKICNNGKIVKPKDRTFPYGPYLQCNNLECNSILDKNLKLKSEFIKDHPCPEKDCKGNISEIYNYPNKKKYKFCSLCSYNTRNKIEHALDMKEIQEIYKEEKYKNIEEMYYSSIKNKDDIDKDN